MIVVVKAVVVVVVIPVVVIAMAVTRLFRGGGVEAGDRVGIRSSHVHGGSSAGVLPPVFLIVVVIEGAGGLRPDGGGTDGIAERRVGDERPADENPGEGGGGEKGQPGIHVLASMSYEFEVQDEGHTLAGDEVKIRVFKSCSHFRAMAEPAQ